MSATNISHVNRFPFDGWCEGSGRDGLPKSVSYNA